MPERVLVTGAEGFVGRALVPRLKAAGFEVWSHCRTDGDLAEAPPAHGGASCVVHMAGRTFVPDSWQHPERFYRDNTLATANVLEYCRRDAARLVYVSAYVYGVPRRLPIAETHPLQPSNPYAHSKVLAEDMVRFYQDKYALPATIVRPFNLYGPGQDERFLVPTIIHQAVDVTRAAISLESTGSRRDYLYVEDLVDLLVAALRGQPGGTYNAGSGESAGVEEIVDVVREILATGKPLQVAGHVRPGEIPETVADVSRAAAELGWRPSTPLRAGLAQTIASVKRAGAPS